MPGPVIFIFFVWLVLFIISGVLLFRSFKKKVPLQILLYLTCFLLTGYSVVAFIISELDYRKMERENDRQNFRDLKQGDTVTIKGCIAFRCYDPYEKQDSILNAEHRPDTGIFKKSNYILLERKVTEYGREYGKLEFVNVSATDFASLKKYLNYKQQKLRFLSYELQVNLKKLGDERYTYLWELVKIIKIDSLKKIPPIEGDTDCINSLMSSEQ